ncbi:MAG: 3-dehydroquinate synthase [Verrucomicrobiae bacterium]|nr:3-dehydroquinate synthase [Verrucomicrobiae bacterium]
MDRVRVELGERSYDIFIGAGLLSQAAPHLKAAGVGNRGVIITDSNVAPLYAGKLQEVLRGGGFAAEIVTVPAGESSKSMRQVNRLIDRLPALGLDRKSFVIALGGGVVGDLAGFVAGIYLRGLAFVQMPTSLLAQVDSSVGGKTGVNLPQGKNLVGVFYQPRLVLADTGLLASLPDRELRSGYAEVIKHGAIYDAEFFNWLERAEKPAQDLVHVVRRCCEIKGDVVGKDERESGLRAILNFGHTIGHAMEALSDYVGLLHGEAISIGMCCAAELSVRRGGLSRPEADRIRASLAATGLPTKIGDRFNMSDLRAAMQLDKKNVAGKQRFVLLKRLGEAFVSDAVTDRDVEEVINVCR